MIKPYNIRLLLIFGLFLCSFVTVWGQRDSVAKQPVTSRKTYEPAPVVPFRDTLFFINAGIGTFSPKDRAMSIAEKIRNMSKDVSFNADSLNIIADGGYIEIAYRDLIIMTITENDAKITGKKQLVLAQECEKLINDAIIQRQKEMGWKNILLRILIVSLIVVAQYFLIRLINILFRKISERVEQLKGKIIKTVKIKSFVLMDEEKTTKYILFLIRLLRYLIILLTLYLSIPLAFSVFPATKNLANTLFGYILLPIKSFFSSIISFIPDLISIIVIILVFRYLIKMFRFFADEIEKKRLTIKGFYPDWAFPTFNIIRILLFAFMFVLIFPLLPNSDSEIFKGVSVFIGVIFTLGSSSVVTNVVSGLVLTYMRPFKVGDRIKIGELIGNVVEKTPLVTRIRTPKNEEVTIPNSTIMSAQTFNYSHSARTYGLILHTKLTFGYETSWRKIHELLLEAAKRTPDVLEKPKPFVLQTALDDFYAEYQLNVYIKDADKMPRIYTAMYQNIMDVFHEAGIEIMSPHYLAHRDGNKTMMPDEFLPEDYQAPPFHMKVEK